MYGFLNNISYVGFISTFLTLISIITYFVSIPMIQKTNKSKLFMISLLFFSLSYFLFIFAKSFLFFIIVAIFMTIVYTLKITTFGLMVKDFSRKNQLSKNEGLIYTFTNIAWILGPLAAGFIVSKFTDTGVFIFAFLFILIGLVLFLFSEMTDNHLQKNTEKRLLNNLIDFFKSRKRIISYIIGSGVGFWWVLIYLFIPLYIIKNNLGEIWISYFLFAVPIPLILFEYKFSVMASRHGFKSLFKSGYLIVALISFLCFFISNIYIVLVLLVFASIGMAMLEPTTEAYFLFIFAKSEEHRFYDPYNTQRDVAGLIGKLIPSLFLIWLPIESVFIIFRIIIFLMFLISFKVRK